MKNPPKNFRPKVLLIDNYDSFTYNLKQLIDELGFDCRVYRNDAITLDQIEELGPSRIVISPGPGNPDSAGMSLEIIRMFSGRVPLLGVCLGHQAIGQAFGGDVVKAPRPKHGKVSTIVHEGTGIFSGVPSPMQVARYHSLVIDRDSLPDCLEISAESEDGLIMGVKHRDFDLQGVQFHPESVATQYGRNLMENFLQAAS